MTLSDITTDSLITDVSYFITLGRWVAEYADECAGRPLTADERETFNEAIRNSSVPDSIDTIVSDGLGIYPAEVD